VSNKHTGKSTTDGNGHSNGIGTEAFTNLFTGSPANQLATLRATFPDRPYLRFRHFAKTKHDVMRWQALRPVLIEIKVGEHWLAEEALHLEAWASTPEGLVDKLG
jgi:hypothetical protein